MVVSELADELGEGAEACDCGTVVIAVVDPGSHNKVGDDVVVDTDAGAIGVEGVRSDDAAVVAEGCECTSGERLIKVSALGESRK